MAPKVGMEQITGHKFLVSKCYIGNTPKIQAKFKDLLPRELLGAEAALERAVFVCRKA